MDVVIEAKELLVPKKLSMFDIEQSFVKTKQGPAITIGNKTVGEKEVIVVEDEEELWSVLNTFSPPWERKHKREEH